MGIGENIETGQSGSITNNLRRISMNNSIKWIIEMVTLSTYFALLVMDVRGGGSR